MAIRLKKELPNRKFKGNKDTPQGDNRRRDPSSTAAKYYLYECPHFAIYSYVCENGHFNRAQGGGNRTVIQYVVSGLMQHTIESTPPVVTVLKAGDIRDTFNQETTDVWVKYQAQAGGSEYLCIMLKNHLQKVDGDWKRGERPYELLEFADIDVINVANRGDQDTIVICLEGQVDWTGDPELQDAITDHRIIEPGDSGLGLAVGTTKLLVIS